MHWHSFRFFFSTSLRWICGKGNHSQLPLLAVVRTTMLGARRRSTKTPSSSCHAFLAHRYSRPEWLLKEYTKEAGGWLPRFWHYFRDMKQPNTAPKQGRNHFCLVNVAHELKLAPPLKWAATKPSFHHHFTIISPHQCHIFGGETQSHTGPF